MNSHECNYTVTERECLTVIFACKQFCVYIHGTMFEVVTDHASLIWLQNLKDPEGRLARWALKLQAYTYTITHCPGIKHQNADCLSCLPDIHHIIVEADDLFSTMITQDLSGLEPKIDSLILRLCIDTVVQKGILYKITKVKKLIYPKPSDRISLVLKSHHEVGHSGFA